MVFSLKSAVKPSKRSRVLVRKETTAAYLFLLPSLIFFLGFVIFPIVLCVWTSFFDSTMNSADVFVGLANYKELFQDKVFLGALKNTLIIVVVSVPITCVFSLWVSSVIVDLKGWATSLFVGCGCSHFPVGSFPLLLFHSLPLPLHFLPSPLPILLS